MYEPFILPDKRFDALTTEQATEYLRAFVDRIPARLLMLEDDVRLEMPAWRSDLSEESLAALGIWLTNHVEDRSLTEKERAEFFASAGPKWEFLADINAPLTDESVSYGIDVGIYVGECIRTRCHGTKWKRGGRQKQDRNRPVLAGFKSKSEYDPIALGGQVASTLLRTRKKLRGGPSVARTPIGEQIAAHLASLPAQDPATVLPERLAAWLRSYATGSTWFRQPPTVG